MPALSLRLPEDLDHRLEDEARLERLPRSEVVRIAIVDYLARRERERFMAELAAEAHTAYTDDSIRSAALEMAEEGMVTSDEALDIAEGRKPGGSRFSKPTEKWWK
ncbi:ribbon-helix-helix protein, CopG family [Pelotalea chapellei]|uniref:Ribbon-helix-helix protein, CopG family n=1 Tax=Pelotalea chapellei TaxID=44671 RepID=A0ABS5U4Z8_9BACT|nr:ribbon-helix-helix protein, CopG family [Pelotalea chapellei]MBT1070741.1 ribbon-helix-helix protein, CopG family [Pelotalea chapellei]